MTDPAFTLIRASVVPVGPRATSSDEQAALLRQYFALSLITSISAAAAPALANRELGRLLFPWRWPEQGWEPNEPGDLIVYARDKRDQTICELIGKVDLTPCQPKLTADGERKVRGTEATDGWLQNDIHTNYAFLTGDSQPDSAKPRLSALLAYLGTLAGNIPQVLRLVRYFRLAWKGPEPEPAGLWDNIDAFVAAPSLLGYTLVAPSTLSDQEFDEASTHGLLRYLRNVDLPDEPCPPAIQVAPLIVGRVDKMLRFDDEPLMSKSPGLSFSDYWIRPRSAEGELEDRCNLARTVALAAGEWAAGPAPQLPGAVADKLVAMALNAFASADATKDDEQVTAIIASLHEIDEIDAPTAADVKATMLQFLGTLDDAQQWGRVVESAFGPGASAATVTDLLDEDAEAADVILFHQWNVALQNSPLGPWWTPLSEKTKVRAAFGLVPDSGAPWSPRARRLARARALAAEAAQRELKTSRVEAPTDPHKPDALERRAELRRLLRAWFDETLAAFSAGGAQRWRPNLGLDWAGAEGASIVQLWQQLRDASTNEASVDLLPPTNVLPPTRLDRKPRGLALQLERPHGEARGRDPWDKLAGVGVLLREKSEPSAPKKWRATSGADLVALDGTKLFDESLLVPLRMPFARQSDAADAQHWRMPFVAYEQESIGSSALGEAAAASFDVTPQQLEESTLPSVKRPAPYVYSAPTGDRMCLTPLKFGRNYEVAAFQIDVASGMPDELCDSHPWVMRRDDFCATLDKLPPADAVLTLQYRRHVGIGHVRLCSLSTAGKPQSWPSLPDDVHPLSREPAAENGNANERGAERPPLLLSDAASKVCVGVKVPSVDLGVLERSLASKDDVIRAVAWYLEQMDAVSASTFAGSRRLDFDSSFDDPAIAGLGITVDYTDGLGQTVSKVFAPLDLATVPEKDPFRRDWLQVTCQRGDAFNVAKGMDGFVVTLAKPTDDAPGGCFARISVHALVSKDADVLFADRFFDEVLQPVKSPPPEWSAYHVLPAETFVAEVVSPHLPSEEQLWRALSCEVNAQTRDVELKLKVEAGNRREAALLRNIGPAALLRQVLVWRGRPFGKGRRSFDWKQVPNVDQQAGVLEWEAGAFADYDDDLDSLRVRLGYLPVMFGASTIKVHGERIDDQRSHYLRYGLEVQSRYGLNVAAAVRTRQPEQTGLAVPPGLGVRRALLPYRGPDLAKPVVKAIIPLTEGVDASGAFSKVAPLLVVLDEAAHQAGGAAEGLVAEIATTPSGLLEVGPDPVVTKAKLELSGASRTTRLEGAFGYTFDRGARNPVFNASSYLLNVPLADDAAPGVDRAWLFMKVRFRRFSDETAELPNLKLPEDCWTEPVWVQFMPSMVFGKDLSFEVSGSSLTIRGLTTLSESFEYYLLVTLAVSDYAGDPCERLHEVVRAAADVARGSLTAELASNSAKRHVRLLEVQRVKPAAGAAPGPAFIEGLIPTPPSYEPTQDAAYRITRMSRKLDLNRSG
ncbi:MAG: hypothetical protein K0R38_420 [Polyangiaceae bacterium]|jgi:hypothetical protein|nr:hypothetical protein [Polyangiaceae bacterium]